MSVDDWVRWAKRRADEDGALGEPGSTVRSVEYKVGRVDGATEAFSALLSDEATMGAVDLLREAGHDIGGVAWRAALQAAVDAVTKEARND